MLQNCAKVGPKNYQQSNDLKSYQQHLNPPSHVSDRHVFAHTGGNFYSKENPEAEPYVSEGQSFQKGQTLGILEVMKMFNPILAEFAGTIEKVCVDGTQGKIVCKGDTLFEITPESTLHQDHAAEGEKKQKQRALSFAKEYSTA